MFQNFFLIINCCFFFELFYDEFKMIKCCSTNKLSFLSLPMLTPNVKQKQLSKSCSTSLTPYPCLTHLQLVRDCCALFETWCVKKEYTTHMKENVGMFNSCRCSLQSSCHPLSGIFGYSSVLCIWNWNLAISSSHDVGNLRSAIFSSSALSKQLGQYTDTLLKLVSPFFSLLFYDRFNR